MAITIKIKDAHLKDLIEFYSLKQRALKEEISELEKKLMDITATISQLKRSTNNSEIGWMEEKEVFSSKWPWSRKIAYAINEAGKPITTKEIVDILDSYDPISPEDKKSTISSVSATLSVKSGKHNEKKDFVKSVSESGEYAYDIWREQNNLEEGNKFFGSQILVDDLPF